MHDEDDFLQKLLENPADDTTRLVYADWLDERDNDESKTKAQFLRLTAQLSSPEEESHITRKLQQLAAGLNTDWLAVVSRLKIEYCAGKQNKTLATFPLWFNFVCAKRWDELTVTENNAVRFCEGCKKNVHYCDTITVARRHAQKGHCVAVDLGIVRRKDDIRPPIRGIVVGMPSPESMREEEERAKREEEERAKIDDVSLAREQAKSAKKRKD